MLESQLLWISSPDATRAPESRRGEAVRTVRADIAGRELGLIVSHPLRWWPWNVVATISAFEGPDRSAVFAGRRAGWLPGDWDVHEADGRIVGLVRGVHILHSGGEILGRIVRERMSATGRIVAQDGTRLTKWAPQETGTRIEFATSLDEEPFAKMAAIIAVVIGL